MFVDLMFIYWSGNTNQIYRTLVQLHKEDLVAAEVQHQESGPSRNTNADHLPESNQENRVGMR